MKHKVIWGVLGLIAFFAGFVALIPQGGVCCRGRIGRDILQCASATRTQVEVYLEEYLLEDEIPEFVFPGFVEFRKSGGYINPCPEIIDAINVTESGAILMENHTYGVVMKWMPIVSENGSIHWKCEGRPEKYVPKYCRHD